MGRVVLVFISLLVCQLSTTIEAQLTYINRLCKDTNINYTEGSVYEKNLKLLFSSLNLRSTSLFRFSNYTIGDTPNRVYGLFQCRYDVSLDVCKACVNDATKMIIEECPTSGEAIVWYEECMLRNANRNIFSLSETSPSIDIWRMINVTNYDQFAPILADAMNDIIKNASDALPHYASGVTTWKVSENLYTYAQCTPDIDTSDCNTCLREALYEMKYCCDARSGAAAFLPSCQLRYDTVRPIWKDHSSPVPPPASPINQVSEPSRKISLKSSVMWAIIVGCVAVVLIIIAVVWWRCVCRTRRTQVSNIVPQALPEALPEAINIVPQSSARASKIVPQATLEVSNVVPKASVKASKLVTKASLEASNVVPQASAKASKIVCQASPSITECIAKTEIVRYNFATLEFATEGFSNTKMLGKGGYGSVYKGELDGKDVAIKRLSLASQQGAKEFKAEALVLAKLQHNNLVKLLGFCAEEEEKLLVYEYMRNSSLERFLFENASPLSWATRFKIILGIAKGLQYLHEDSPNITIHRDLKPENILLDDDKNPKIADFGLARLTKFAEKCGVTNDMKGTDGYFAPERADGEYSPASDVYSFGVMLLEIVSGWNHRAYFNTTLTTLQYYARRLWDEKRTFELRDPKLGNNCSEKEVTSCIHIALLCLQKNPQKRPKISSIVAELTSYERLPALSARQQNVPIDNGGSRSSTANTFYTTPTR